MGCISILPNFQQPLLPSQADNFHNLRELEEFCLGLDILPFDAAAGIRYREIRQALTERGRVIGANDLLIAAHARSADATLVTNNEGEFGRVPGLRMEHPPVIGSR